MGYLPVLYPFQNRAGFFQIFAGISIKPAVHFHQSHVKRYRFGEIPTDGTSQGPQWYCWPQKVFYIKNTGRSWSLTTGTACRKLSSDGIA